MRRALVLCALAACGDTASAPDAQAGCQLELAGNLAESSSSQAACPMLAPGAGADEGDTLLLFSAPSEALGDDLAIRIDLGAEPSPGVYNSGTTALWNAMSVRSVPPMGACLYIAGNNANPTGDFVLDLSAIDIAAGEAHGSLALTLFVLPRTSDDGMQTDCGAGTTVSAQLMF